MTIDNVTGVYAIGLKEEPNHKFVTCRRFSPSASMVLNTMLAEVKIIPYVSLNLSPHKFSDHGDVTPCYGTTIICKIPSKDNMLYNDLLAAQNLIRESVVGDYYGYVAPTSFHMTLFDLKRCEAAQVSERIATQREQLKDLLPVLKMDKYPMMITEIEQTAFHVALQPLNGVTRGRRSEISRLTGINNYEGYVFHITLAYELYKIVDEDLVKERNVIHGKIKGIFQKWINASIEMQSVVMCQFENMNHFEEII